MGNSCSSRRGKACGTMKFGCMSVPKVCAAKAPFLHVAWPACSSVARGTYRPVLLTSGDLKMYQQEPHAHPVYVSLPFFGTSVTHRFRYVNGVKHYAVRKLNPKSDSSSIQYYDVPEFYHGPDVPAPIRVVHPMRLAIAYFVPDTAVRFYKDDGTQFTISYDLFLKIDDCDVAIAVQALLNDHAKELDPVLEFQKGDTPMFNLKERYRRPPETMEDTGSFLTGEEAEQERERLIARGELPENGGQPSMMAQSASPFAREQQNGSRNEDLEETDAFATVSSSSKIGDLMTDGRGYRICDVIDLQKVSDFIASCVSEPNDGLKDVYMTVNHVGKLVSSSPAALHSDQYNSNYGRQKSVGFSIGDALHRVDDVKVSVYGLDTYPLGNQYYGTKDLGIH